MFLGPLSHLCCTVCNFHTLSHEDKHRLHPSHSTGCSCCICSQLFHQKIEHFSSALVKYHQDGSGQSDFHAQSYGQGKRKKPKYSDPQSSWETHAWKKRNSSLSHRRYDALTNRLGRNEVQERQCQLARVSPR